MRNEKICSYWNNSDIIYKYKSPNASTDDELTITEKSLIDRKVTNVSIFNKFADPLKCRNELSELLQTITMRKEQERYKNVINTLVTEIVADLNCFTHDEEYFGILEHHICNIEHEYSFETMGTVLQTIYVGYNDQPKMLVGICKALCRYDLSEVMPWGPTMLAGLLNNKSELVKEYAIELVENWADIRLLPLLKNLEISTKWLKAYLQDVINYIEEKNVLYTKNQEF